MGHVVFALPLAKSTPVAVQLADHGAVRDVEGREKAGDAVPGVVVGALLVHAERDGFLRRVVVEPGDVDDFATNSGSVLSLNPSIRCGLRSNFRQIRPTVNLLRPLRRAIESRDQWVASRAFPRGWR